MNARFSDLRSAPRRGRQGGSAVIVVLALVSILLIYLAGNLKMLHHLRQEIRLVEQRQTRRLEPSKGAAKAGVNPTAPKSSAPATNSAAPAK